jgi:hypothetical protein
MPREFYPAEFTTRSRSVLDLVVGAVPTAVLIGGWATWVRTSGPMSHDIDVIVDHGGLEAIRAHSDDVTSSSHLGGRKWRATIDGIHLDLYIPYQSRLGQRLGLRAESLVGYAETVDGWHVLSVPAHLATKIAALLDRPDTMPGEKDRSEILALLPEADGRSVIEVIETASEHDLPVLQDDLTKTLFEYLAETEGLGRPDRDELRRTQREWTTTVHEVVGSRRPESDL